MKNDDSKGGTKSIDHLMKKFAKSTSSAEIKNTANKIIESEPDIDKENLEEARNQFHKEKRDDAAKQAQNDAQFDQPKP